MNDAPVNQDNHLEQLLTQRQEWEDYVPINQAAQFLKEEQLAHITQSIDSLQDET
ncbi:hypothetical protein [Staphylococcus sp. 11261D007BR]